MADALAPLVIELRGFDDISRCRPELIDAMTARRPVIVMAYHGGERSLVFRAKPSGSLVHVIAPDALSNGRWPNAAKAVSVGLRQAERFFDGRWN